MGVYTPPSSETIEVDGVMVPPAEVVQVGISFWFEYLLEFFLVQNPRYHVVKEHYS